MSTLMDFQREELQRELDRNRVVLLPPHSRRRNAIAATIFSLTGVYWHSLSPEDTSLLSFLNTLVNSFRDLSPGFGQRLLEALQLNRQSLTTLADALLADIHAFKPRFRYLILDSFDYLHPGQEVTAFFNQLIARLPDNLHLIINARSLSRALWLPLIQAGDAIVLGSPPKDASGLFPTASDGKPYLQVFALGAGRVYLNGTAFDRWDGPLVRELFFYLLEHPRSTRTHIFENFWPAATKRDATNVFHVTKRKMAQVLGLPMFIYGAGYYERSPQIFLDYDVSHFEIAIKQARLSGNLQTWAQAIALYRCGFLMGSERAWILHRREQLRAHYAEALIATGQDHKVRGASDMALSFFLRALAETPQRQDIHREVMGLYAQSGQASRAISHYRVLENTLQHTLGVDPEQTTLAMYEAISSQQAP